MSRGSGFGPAVLDGELRYVSASQIEKFDVESYGGCPRRWGFGYIVGKREPEIKAQRLGKQCHSQIEHYLDTGENVLGPIALAGFRFLPKPKTTVQEVQIGALLEHMPGGFHGPVVSELDCAGVPVVGFVDCVNASGAAQNDAGDSVIEPNVVEAIDWKTTKRIDDEVDPDTGIVLKRGLAKTAEQLSRTHQMVGYGEWLRRRHPNIVAVRLSHGVFQTQRSKVAVKRSALVTVDEVRERWRRSEKVVEAMKAAASVTDVLQLPANLASCSAFGKACPFQADCPRESKDHLASLFGRGKAMSLLDKIRMRRTGTEVEAAMTTAAAAVPSAPAPYEFSAAALAAETAKLASEEAAIRSASVTPPDAPEPTPVKPAELVYNGAKLAELEAPKLETVEPVKKRGRPPKSAEPVAEPAAGLTLYLDCIEDGVAAQRLDGYVQGLADELARAAGAADIRCAGNDTALGFGRYKGALAATARAAPPPSGAYLASSTNELVAIVVEALRPTARVIQGVK